MDIPLPIFSRLNIFHEKFYREGIRDTHYELFPIDDLGKLLPLIEETTELKGLNVTIPYKQTVIPFLSSMDEIAKEAGAVNTIKIIRNNDISLQGYNTDVFGFEESLKPLLKREHKKALILGTGGASIAVAYVLKKTRYRFSFRYEG